MSELTVTGRFDAAGVSLNYRVDGIGSRFLVCVHGEEARLEAWDSTVPELADAFTILRYDLHGHGMSTQGKSPGHIDDFVHEFMSLVDHTQVLQFDLAGCSLGELIALRTALVFSGRVRRLVLLSAVGEDVTNLVVRQLGPRVALVEIDCLDQGIGHRHGSMRRCPSTAQCNEARSIWRHFIVSNLG